MLACLFISKEVRVMNEQEFIMLKADCEVYKSKVDKLEFSFAKIQDRVTELETKSEKTDFQYDQIMKMLDKLNEQTIPELSKEIQALKSKPAERFNTIITSVLSTGVGAIVGFIFSKLLT